MSIRWIKNPVFAVATAVCFLGTVSAYAGKPVGQSEVDTLQAEVDVLQTEVGTLQAEVGALQTQTGTLQAEIDSLQTQTQAEADALQAQIDTLFTAFPPKHVFVTSEVFMGDLGAGLASLTSGAEVATGIAAGDRICQVLAETAGHSGSYLAWLGSPRLEDTPVARFSRSIGGYENTNGVMLAANWDDLTDGVMPVPLNVDEFGATVLPEYPAQGLVWTNVHWRGGVSDMQRGASDCEGWTSSSSDRYGAIGRSNYTDGYWSNYAQNSCSGAWNLGAHLYCFEQ